MEYFGRLRSLLESWGIPVIVPVLPRTASIATRATQLKKALHIQPEEFKLKRRKRKNNNSNKNSNNQTTASSVNSKPPTSVMGDSMDSTSTTASENNINHRSPHPSTVVKSTESVPTTQAARAEAAISGSASTVQTNLSYHDPAQTDNKLENDAKHDSHSNQSFNNDDYEDDDDEEDDDESTKVPHPRDFDVTKYKGKFHIIAHSMGGLDSRYLITHLGGSHRIASLTTIATPHFGSPIADVVHKWILDIPINPFTKNNNSNNHAEPKEMKELSLSDTQEHESAGSSTAPSSTDDAMKYTLMHALSKMGDSFGIDVRGITNLTSSSMEQFNSNTPDDPNVRYYSWGAAKKFSIFSIFYLPAKIIDSVEKQSHCNDGLVSVDSSRWGKYQGTCDLDHVQQIGLGLNDRHLNLYYKIISTLGREDNEEKLRKEIKKIMKNHSSTSHSSSSYQHQYPQSTHPSTSTNNRNNSQSSSSSSSGSYDSDDSSYSGTSLTLDDSDK